MKHIMLEHLKAVKEIANQPKPHSRGTFSYDNYQQLLKLAAKNNDQTNGANSPRATRKLLNQDLALELTEAFSSSEEICNVDLPAPVLIANMMSRRGDINRYNNNSSGNVSFDEN